MQCCCQEVFPEDEKKVKCSCVLTAPAEGNYNMKTYSYAFTAGRTIHKGYQTTLQCRPPGEMKVMVSVKVGKFVEKKRQIYNALKGVTRT